MIQTGAIDAKNLILEYNEEEEPVMMLDKHRREISRRFETTEGLAAYLRQFSSVEAARAILHARVAALHEKLNPEFVK
ncbi:MAG: hypothetical protein ACRC10_07350 [Thermoguttaceae bacterium]